MRQLAEERRHTVRVALVGNPNCGKTSLFNIASGSHEHVGNYSGVTVDAKEGRFEYKGYHFVLVDLPGTYSLSAYSPEELYVRKNLIDNIPDVVINVVDASNLERNLYLTAQIIDMNLRVVMAMNMYDELEARGDRLDTVTLGHLLGMPVVPTVSRSGQGIDRLFDTVIQIYEHNEPTLSRHIHINHGQELENSIDRIKLLIQKNDDIRTHYSTRWLGPLRGEQAHRGTARRHQCRGRHRRRQVRLHPGRPQGDLHSRTGAEKAYHYRQDRRRSHQPLGRLPDIHPPAVHHFRGHLPPGRIPDDLD